MQGIAEYASAAAGLSILADACMGLGCDEQLETQADKSPFKPLEPLSELPDLALGPDSPDLLHLSGRRPQASAPAYPSAALAQRILGERSEPPALPDLPAEVAVTSIMLSDPASRLWCAVKLECCINTLMHPMLQLYLDQAGIFCHRPLSMWLHLGGLKCTEKSYSNNHCNSRVAPPCTLLTMNIRSKRVSGAQVQAHMRPHMGAPNGDDAAVAPVELLCAEADHALQQLQGNNASSSWTSSSEDTPSLSQAQYGEDDNSSISSSGGAPISANPDEQSMWVDEQIAEAEFLQQLEDSDSPVEATAQLSLPMFPDLADLDVPTNDQQRLHSSNPAEKDSRESGGKEEVAGKAEGPTSSRAAQGLVLNSAASMPELEEDFVTPAGSPRKQAASAPPVLDLRFTRSDSLASAASFPALDSKKYSACRSSGGLRLTRLVCRPLFTAFDSTAHILTLLVETSPFGHGQFCSASCCQCDSAALAATPISACVGDLPKTTIGSLKEVRLCMHALGALP